MLAMLPSVRLDLPSPNRLRRSLTLTLLALAPLAAAPSSQAQPSAFPLGGQEVRAAAYASPERDGPSFEIGHYEGTVDFDPDPVGTEYRTSTTSEGNPELYLAGYTPDGGLRFVHVFPSRGAVHRGGQGIHVSAAVEDEGGISFTGHFWGDVDFDPDPGVAARVGDARGGWRAFVASFATDGALRYVREVGGSPLREGAVPSGYGERGARSWEQSFRTVAYASPERDGPSFEIGHYEGTVDFDPDPVGTEYRTSTTSEGNPELYLAGYTPDGGLRFVHVFPATGSYPWNLYGVFVNAVVEDEGGISFTGHFWGDVDFDPDPDATVLMQITPDGSNAFVASFTTDGDLGFARDIGGDPYGNGNDLATDAAGNLFTTGYYQTSEFDYTEGIYVEGYTDTGEVRFSHLLASIYADVPPYYVPSGGFGQSVTTDAAGNVIVKGRFFGILDFDPDPNASATLTSARPQDPGYTDPFVASYTGTGEFRYAYVGTEAPSDTYAYAGLDQTVIAGQTVTLDGSASHALDGTPLTFDWTLRSLAGSAATLSDPDAVSTRFCADIAGSFSATLVVGAGGVLSEPDAVAVTVLTQEAAIDSLAAGAAALGPPPTGDGTLEQGLIHALTNQLDQTRRALGRGRPDLAPVHLAAFSSQVSRLQSGGYLPEVRAGALLDVADAIAEAAATPCSAEASALQASPPQPLVLHSAWPNPSTSSTTLSFEVDETAEVRLSVYDVRGREVTRLIDGPMAPGRHEVSFDASGLPSGVYLARLTRGDGIARVQRLTVLR